MTLHTRTQLLHLVPQLTELPSETEWVEFKVDNDDPQMIGKTLAALSNSARLVSEPYGYLVWGVSDGDHQIVGSSADPSSKKVGQEDILNWLTRLISPETYFEFTVLQIAHTRVVVATIEAASFQPVQFSGTEYVRIGSHVKPLSRHPDAARRLWKAFDRQPFETGTARDRLDEDEVLQMLDYPAYFDMLSIPLPDNRAGIIEALHADELIAKMAGTGWRVTNLGAVLMAKNLTSFPSLQRHAPRVIQYRGMNRLETVREQVGARGYAAGFEGLISFINGLLPMNEVIGQALRTTTPLFPELAIRELVANALIHQDFTVTGAGPMIEVFDDRIEISNPGAPLVDVSRLIDAPPRSRNEKLASLMRRMGVCEEQGSGWDKVAFQIEFYQLPAPVVEINSGSMRVVVLSPRPLSKMTSEDKVRAVYLHACLRYLTRENTNNASIRERFGISEQNKAIASRLLGEAVRQGAIVPYDPTAGPRAMRYVPFWASTANDATGFVDA